MTIRLTKKQEIRILDKILQTIHGENWLVCKKVMEKILVVDRVETFDGLQDLKRKYKLSSDEISSS